METIPVLDFNRISTKNGRRPSREDWTFVAGELDKALSTIGFAYVINHDIDQVKISKAFERSKCFFEQSTELKQKYLKNTTKSHHGYVNPGQEILHPGSGHEIRESYDFVTDPKKFTVCEIENFDSANMELKNECRPVIKKILKALAISLGLDDEEFFVDNSKNIDDYTNVSYSAFRTIYYPQIGNDVAPNTVRCGEHSDYGILTILFQDDVGGLQVRTVDQKWISATPIPGSILINTGDLLEFWSNGYFPATKHRVLIPEAEIKKKTPRQSIVYFHHPDNSAIVTPLGAKNPIDKNEYGSINAGDYAQQRLDSTYKY
ncbi:UPF0676 protein C1494.01-like isoform X2 [Bradysia coprophila]|uniref:UPF0676 protein C1494.01-like isoform X1 n=1 Tax=Bradysia coprophila TaxID=38358 RepID=UPI00187D6FFC|nr:UPF0676 protein C1494.01-like isoform X1 [Bradysia coprophila]XP_037035050.1 UPF0676 protein C1494.01-like isoform X2 [Bradysia coprophila]